MSSFSIGHLYLLIAILGEVIGTNALKACEEFTKPIPSMLVIGSYVVAFYALMLCFRTMPVSIAYAIWCGLGIVLVALLGWGLFGEKLDIPAIIGLLMIIGGTIILQLFSKTSNH